VSLLGRDPELTALAAACADVRAGARRTVGLVGEAGIGKSALLDAAAARARAAGLLVLTGRAAEHEREVPFGLVVDALDDHVATLNPTRVAAAGPELGVVLPAIADGHAPLDMGGPAERFRYHRALRMLLELLGRERPVALLLDDVQWADAASVELILHLLRRPPRVRFLLVLALRPSPAAARLLDAGRRSAGWDEVILAPLERNAALALLPSDLAAAHREQLLADAGGNPLFLRELGRRTPGEGEPVPSTLAAVVGQELEDLDPAVRGFLDGAAVAGDPFDLDVAAAAAGVDRAGAAAALDALVAVDLVRPAGHRRTLRFRHPLVHRAIADAAPPGWRLLAHERAAYALLAIGADPAIRAYHVEQFARPGDEAAIALLTEAAEAATDTSPAAAAHWYGAALSLLPHGAGTERAALLAPMADALTAAGRLQESRAAVEECLALLPPEATEQRAMLAAGSALVDVLLGDFAAADARLHRALQDAPPSIRPRLTVYRASTAFFRGDVEAVTDWSRRAAEELEGVDDPVAEASIEAMEALGLALTGRPAAELMQRSAQRLAAVDDAVLARQVDAAWAVGGNLGQIERYAEALEVLQRGVRVARAERQDHLFLHFHTLMAMFELPLLQLDRALEHAEAAEEAARLQGLTHELAFALCARARILLVRGEPSEAERAAVESDELFGARQHVRATRTSLAHNATVRLASDPERLLAELTALGGPRLEQLNPAAVTGLLLIATRAAIALGRLDESERWAEVTIRVADGPQLPASSVRGVRARAEVLLARDDARAAARLAASAVDDAERLGLRQEEVGARLLAGRALLAAGARDAAVAELQRVAADAGRLGAGADRDAAGRELRRAGVRISSGARRAADTAGRNGLTERERSVAELVAAGRSNKEVAATLFLSEKTVEANLTRIYDKLGVRSRTELASSWR
jgi:DNA-binding CsgD family transcriptional regulator